MPNLIDSTFFVGEINIPNTSKPEVNEAVNLFISTFEPELLKKLLGFELYDSFKEDRTTNRFLDLVNGKGDWRGLVYQITDTVKGSLIAYYVYNYWIKDKQLWNSGVGVIRPKGDNSEVMPISLKMMEAWNNFSHQVSEFVYYMDYNKEVYPEWSPIDPWQFKVTNDFDI